MKLEEQVCSLELAKELKELGVKQDSMFYWEHTETLGIFSAKTEEKRNKFIKNRLVQNHTISR